MVKAVIGEETQLNSAEKRLTQSRVAAQIGLIIGKISVSLDRGFVYHLIPTPANDAGHAACTLIQTVTDKKKGAGGSKSKSQSQFQSRLSPLSIDSDWVAEHARQVSRMLLGGMKVVGIYIWVDESSFKNSTLTICQTVKGVAEAAALSDCDERLLINISYSPMRWTCRSCTINSNITTSSLHPCDFKMGRVLSSLQKFKCTYNFDVRFPVRRGSRLKKLAEILRHEMLSQANELKAAKALIDGKLVVVDDQCVQEGLHEVEFLVPFMQDTSVEACSQKEVAGVVSYNGSICSYAYLNPKEAISQALADLKGDIITSLESRLDIVCDEALEMDGDVELDTGAVSQIGLLQLSRKMPFPRRVFVPWLEGTYICDYLQPSEALEVVKDHCVELISMEAETNNTRILEVESEASALTTIKSFLELTMPATATSNNDKKSSSSSSTSANTFNSTTAAVLVLFLPILVGMLLLLFTRGTF